MNYCREGEVKRTKRYPSHLLNPPHPHTHQRQLGSYRSFSSQIVSACRVYRSWLILSWKKEQQSNLNQIITAARPGSPRGQRNRSYFGLCLILRHSFSVWTNGPYLSSGYFLKFMRTKKVLCYWMLEITTSNKLISKESQNGRHRQYP